MGFQPGNIAAADAQQPGGFQLGQRRLTGKPVPQQQNLPLPGGQGIQQLTRPADVVLRLAGILHAETVLQHIRQRQSRIPVRFQCFLQGNRAAGFAVPPELHPDLIFDAPAGIGGEPRLACGIKGIYCFHQPDGTDGNKIILITGQGIVFFDDVRHQPQVVPDELFPRGGVSGPQSRKSSLFLPGGERLGEASAFQMKRQNQKFCGEKWQKGQQHESSSGPGETFLLECMRRSLYFFRRPLPDETAHQISHRFHLY